MTLPGSAGGAVPARVFLSTLKRNLNMKAKTIKSVLRRKVDALCDSITDENVAKIARENIVITGGCIASMLLKEKVNDFDVYFRTGEAAFAVASYYLEQFKANPPKSIDPEEIFIVDHDRVRMDSWRPGKRIRLYVKSAGVAVSGNDTPDAEQAYQYFEGDAEGQATQEYVDQVLDAADAGKAEAKGKFRPVFVSSNAITLTDKVQLVFRFFGEPDAIHKNYDFVHCMNHWKSWDGKLTLRPESLEALLARELRYVGSLYPLCSVIRTRKFIGRGWTINAGQLLKMAMQISQLDLSDVDVLEDQLIGVDTAYFVEVITLLRERMRETRSKSIDQTYLIQIIDRIF